MRAGFDKQGWTLVNILKVGNGSLEIFVDIFHEIEALINEMNLLAEWIKQSTELLLIRKWYLPQWVTWNIYITTNKIYSINYKQNVLQRQFNQGLYMSYTLSMFPF